MMNSKDVIPLSIPEAYALKSVFQLPINHSGSMSWYDYFQSRDQLHVALIEMPVCFLHLCPTSLA